MNTLAKLTMLSATVLLAASVCVAVAVPEGGLYPSVDVHGGQYDLGRDVSVTLSLRNYAQTSTFVSPLVIVSGEKPHEAQALAPGVELVLERVVGEKVVSSQRLGPTAAADGKSLQMAPGQSEWWGWTLRPADFAGQEGAYRVRLVRGKETGLSPIFRLNKTREKPDWIALSYTPDKQEYLLGEGIKVHFIVKNDGQEEYPWEFGGDYRGAPRMMRFAFTAVGDDGRKATDPYPGAQHLGGMVGRGGKPGDEREADLPLLAYLRFPGPGVYTVTAYQDLGFGVPVKEVSDKDGVGRHGHRSFGGEFKIKIVEPTADQAEAYLRQVIGRPAKPHEGQPLAELGEPLYLPAIRKILAEKPADEQAGQLIVGVGSICTVEATRLLVELASADHPAWRVTAMRELHIRLPNKGIMWVGGGSELFKHVWDKACLQPIIGAYKKGLRSDSLDEVEESADGLCALDVTDAAPLFYAAADRIAPALPISKAAGRVLGLLGDRVRHLISVGAKPEAADAKSSPGRLVVWACVAKDNPAARGPAWEDLFLHMMRQPDSVLRGAVLGGLPKEFSRRKAIPWKDLFLDADMEVASAAVNTARGNPDIGIDIGLQSAALDGLARAQGVKDDAWPGRVQALKDLLNEIEKAAKERAK
jgi:hypothetical protein